MRITINEELRKFIDPLTEAERSLLERSLLAEGCRDPLVLWGEILIDGHNRYEICRKHGIAFNTVQNDRFQTMEQVMLWMIDNQLSRRSVTDFQRGMLALRKKELLAAGEQSRAVAGSKPEQTEEVPAALAIPKTSRKEVAQIAGVSSHKISQIEKIQKTATPELIDAVRSGTISIGAAAAVASLPEEKQVAAVAGGRKELRQAAKEAREANAPPKPAPVLHAAVQPEADDELSVLRTLNAALQAENMALKETLAALSVELEQARRAA
ncbi:MAG: hypothetical protein JO002_08680 [Burkholderiaceae bacterium]|nr:hypothetical protein [Burkholderiaceae bacterium]